MKINVIRWSNFRFKSITYAILNRLAGNPELEVLPDNSPLLSERTRALESQRANTSEQPPLSWQSQVFAEQLGQRSAKNEKPMFHKIRKDNHYLDCLCMGRVKMLQAGMLGHLAAPVEAAQVAGE